MKMEGKNIADICVVVSLFKAKPLLESDPHVPTFSNNPVNCLLIIQHLISLRLTRRRNFVGHQHIFIISLFRLQNGLSLCWLLVVGEKRTDAVGEHLKDVLCIAPRAVGEFSFPFHISFLEFRRYFYNNFKCNI